MPSWSFDPAWDSGHDDSCAGRYQAAVDRAFREQMRLGVPPPDAGPQPFDPPCALHGYGTVDGLCGVCVLELKARRAAA